MIICYFSKNKRNPVYAMCLTTDFTENWIKNQQINKADTAQLVNTCSGLEITANQPCGGEIFKSIFSLFSLKYFEKSLIHGDDQQLFPALLLKVSKITFNQCSQECCLMLFFWLSTGISLLGGSLSLKSSTNKLLHCTTIFSCFLLFWITETSHGNQVFFHLDWGLIHLHLQIANVWGRKHLSFNGKFCLYFYFLLRKFNKTNLKFNNSKILLS